MPIRDFPSVTLCEARTACDEWLGQTAPRDVVESIEGILFNRPEPAVTAVVESGYVDIDYSASYHIQRGRSFTPTERNTTRVHFFSETFTARQLGSLSRSTRTLLARSYLGFSVIRPGEPQAVGRTILKPPPIIMGLPTVTATAGMFEVNLVGIKLLLEGCPYLSQDQMVMACATAA